MVVIIPQWNNVTPLEMSLNPNLAGPDTNFGVNTVVVDPARPSDLYAAVDCQGIWKSTDYAKTWKKISIGFDNGRPWFIGIVGGKARDPNVPPTMYSNQGYGSKMGLWKSVDGGVTWVQCPPLPSFADALTGGQDPYDMEFDPYDGNHALLGFHGTSEIAETTDGGNSWKAIGLPTGNATSPNAGQSLGIFFIDTGDAKTTRLTWIAISQWGNNTNGVWRTTDGGKTWAQVATFEHFHGSTQVFNAGNGVAYVSATGGVYKTTDAGATWVNINGGNGNGVIGTPAMLYTSFGWADDGTWPAQMASAPRSNDTVWTQTPTPAGMINGSKHGSVTTFDGSNFIVVTPNGNGGIWRLVENQDAPSADPTPVAPAPDPTPAPNPPPAPVPTPSPTAPAATRFTLSVAGGKFQDSSGKVVPLLGVSTMGMCMVYGDKAAPGSYVPMTVADYIKAAAMPGANAVRFIFERFPCADPARLYSVENQPYAMPDTIPFPPRAPNTQTAEGTVCSFGGNRWRAVMRRWRADEGQAWNPGMFKLSDVLTGADNLHLYKCVGVPAVEPLITDWSKGPEGTDAKNPVPDGFGVSWLYDGEAGMTGATEPFDGVLIPDYPVGQVVADGGIWWQKMSADYTPAQAETNFADWKAKVMDPPIDAAIALGLYVVICDFDFGPAESPLRHARMLDFWTRMSKSQWANHPNVIFELWNESEDSGTYPGGAGSWAVQKPVVQETVNAIRATANNIIIAPGPFFSAWIGEETASPLVGANIAYPLHQYRSQYQQFDSNRAQIAQGIASGQAIVMTEGGDDTNPATPGDSWVSTAAGGMNLQDLTKGMAGFFAWSLSQSWSPGMYSDAALKTPNAYGQSVLSWFAGAPAQATPLPTTQPPPADTPPSDPTPPPTQTPPQIAAAAILDNAKAALALAQVAVDRAQIVVAALG